MEPRVLPHVCETPAASFCVGRSRLLFCETPTHVPWRVEAGQNRRKYSQRDACERLVFVVRTLIEIGDLNVVCFSSESCVKWVRCQNSTPCVTLYLGKQVFVWSGEHEWGQLSAEECESRYFIFSAWTVHCKYGTWKVFCVKSNYWTVDEIIFLTVGVLHCCSDVLSNLISILATQCPLVVTFLSFLNAELCDRCWAHKSWARGCRVWN